MWKLLCDNNVINVPMLFDICSIYGQSYKKELEIMFKELFSCQQLYYVNLKNSIQFTIKVNNNIISFSVKKKISNLYFKSLT